jgi:putative membrane protein insertion efficiency factor
MPALQEEAHRRQPDLSALRPAVRKRRGWIIWIAAVVLTAGVFFDWTRPPRQQVSVALYEKIVIGGYRVFLKPLSDRFVRCRFQPTCSQYSEEAMLLHGFPKGLWLTASRLFRCMPWVTVGTRDPVPDP